MQLGISQGHDAALWANFLSRQRAERFVFSCAIVRTIRVKLNTPQYLKGRASKKGASLPAEISVEHG
ncbi:MAG: hypothetical protein QM537_10240, partial [Candidatus Symbiobacter sp.]|nr:hypothetical protein [Candidatus Symbiobacter sp.]